MLHTRFILCCGFLLLTSQSLFAQLFKQNRRSLTQMVSHQLRQQDEWNQQQQPANSILKNLFAPVSEFPAKQPVTYRVTTNHPGQGDEMQHPSLNSIKYNLHLNNPAFSPYIKWLKKKRQREQVAFPEAFLENEF